MSIKLNCGLLADLENKQFTDCTFVFNDDGSEKTFAAHKNILAVVSPVFQATFYGDLKEDGPIKITDITFEVFQKMILIIYGKSVKIGSSEEACQLYYAAQKYDLSEPLGIARSYMLANMSNKTAAQFHDATVLFDDSKITQKCCATLFEKVFDTTKVDGFFESTNPLEGQNTFKLEKSDAGEALQVVLGEHMKNIKKENNLDMESLIVKTFELIRILTSEAKRAFEMIVPKSKAKFTCCLDWIPPTGTVETFKGTCFKRIFPGIIGKCDYGHILQVGNPSYYFCDKCNERRRTNYPKTSEVTSKYGEKDASAYILKDLKKMYDELKLYL